LELKSQKEEIELKAQPGDPVLVPHSVALRKAPNLEPARGILKPYRPNRAISVIQHLADIIIVCSIGGFSIFLVVFTALGFVSGSTVNMIAVLELSLYTGMMGCVLWFACCLFPLWLGVCVLALQAASGAFVGQLIFASSCIILGINPTTVGPAEGIFSFALTLMLTVVPALAMPVYAAICMSSPLRKTIGASMSDYYVADLRGNRLSFKQAFKRSVLTYLEPLLLPLAIARGKNYTDRNSWLEQTSGTMYVKNPESVEEEINKSRQTVLVRYRAFQEVEGVLGQEQDSVPKVMRKVDEPFRRAIHGVAALFVVTTAIALPVGMQVPMAMVRMLTLHGGPLADPFTSSFFHGLENLVSTGLNLFFALIGLMLLYFGIAICRPTHIQLSQKGIRFTFQMMPAFMWDPICAWSKIEQLCLEQTPGKASIADHRLVFKLKDGKKMRLRLGSISSVAGKEEILSAVERWAPELPRSAEVISALQPPCDFSYTELWMEALTAPPKREKLKPLVNGSVLRDSQYIVSKMLGVGGQGTAYLAADSLSEQSVVLKEFLLPVYVDVSARRRALESFEKEARLLKDLSHPNVVKLVDYFVEDHRAYLVLEHIDGRSLRQIVQQEGRRPESEVRGLAVQMCEILKYLHSQSPPVVHRDFTPDNLILRKDGTLKLIDFNVAQQSDSSSALSSVVGKPNYLSPEQFRGAPVSQSDIYAFGACLQYLLTGEDPVAIISSNPRLTRDDVSVELSEIVQKATQPDLANRFASASEILLQLEAQ
jgi:tRNA A-37 threonylcarbamoyl transferase component Bud32